MGTKGVEDHLNGWREISRDGFQKRTVPEKRTQGRKSHGKFRG